MDKLWIRSVQYVFLWISEIAFLRNPKTGPRRRNGASPGHRDRAAARAGCTREVVTMSHDATVIKCSARRVKDINIDRQLVTHGQRRSVDLPDYPLTRIRLNGHTTFPGPFG